MLKRIVVGINAAPASQAAVEAALALAGSAGAELLGVAIVDTPRLTAAEPVPLGGMSYKGERDEAVVHASEAEAAQLLSDFEAHCARSGLPCQISGLAGDAAALLVGEAQRGDLLVLGHDAAAASGDGTQTFQRVVRHAPRPVLAIAGPLPAGAPVLVAYDGSAQAAKALQSFVLLGLASRQPLHVLSVVPAGSQFNPGNLAAEYLHLHGLTADLIRQDSDASAASVIEATAERLGAGLIVMGPFGRPALQEFFLGSVTRSLLSHCRWPLFLYH
jgi:nucleotide-binding universal stress UspA family protein